MKRFEFSLERVLGMRELQVLLAQQALSAARSVAHLAAEQLEAVRQERRDYASMLESRRLGGMPAWEWVATSQRFEVLTHAERQAEASLKQALEVVSARQDEMVKTRQREEALRRLRTARLTEHRRATKAEDQRSADEVAQRRWLPAKGEF